jgi:hypothetical protein
VRFRLKHRPKQQGVGPDGPHVLQPRRETPQPGRGNEIVAMRRAATSERIDVT